MQSQKCVCVCVGRWRFPLLRHSTPPPVWPYTVSLTRNWWLHMALGDCIVQNPGVAKPKRWIVSLGQDGPFKKHCQMPSIILSALKDHNSPKSYTEMTLYLLHSSPGIRSGTQSSHPYLTIELQLDSNCRRFLFENDGSSLWVLYLLLVNPSLISNCWRFH